MKTIQINTGKGTLTVSASHNVKITENNIIITLSKVAKARKINTATIETKTPMGTIKLKADGSPDRRTHRGAKKKSTVTPS